MCVCVCSCALCVVVCVCVKSHNFVCLWWCVCGRARSNGGESAVVGCGLQRLSLAVGVAVGGDRCGVAAVGQRVVSEGRDAVLQLCRRHSLVPIVGLSLCVYVCAVC